MSTLEEHLKYPPNEDEIKHNINRLKDKKASSDIPAEFLKVVIDCPKYISMLRSLYDEVWNDVVLADVWRKQVITPLYLTTSNTGNLCVCFFSSKKNQWIRL